MLAFNNSAVLITGAGRGIGKRLALGFASTGARVGLLARSKAEIDLVALEIEHAGGSSLRLLADVRDSAQVAAAVALMNERFGAVHVAVCASGSLGPIGPLAAADPAAWTDAIQTNLIGAMHIARAVLPGMIDRRAGKLVFLVGPGADAPRPRFAAYSAASTGLVRFAETLAEEVCDSNIQVNCMIPGPTYTSLTDEILMAGEALAGAREIKDATNVRSSGGTPPDKQIELALFLASGRSNHISGKLLSVTDDWRRLENTNTHTELLTLRRLQRI